MRFNRLLGGCGLPLMTACACIGPSAFAADPLVTPGAAIIVNEANGVSDLSTWELIEILTLKKQFWKDGRKIVLMLPPPGSAARRVLLERIYHRSDEEIRKDWSRRLFAGEIPAVPSVAKSAAAAMAIVKQLPGAISIVLSTELEPGVKTLAIDARRPEDAGYPLSAAVRP